MTGWDDLVATALVGTDRRAPDLDRLPDPVRRTASGQDDPAVRLLAAAAALTAWRRAGTSSALAPPAPPTPAPREQRPTAPGTLLRHALASPHDPLLEEWLTVAAAEGLVVPHDVLPALLDHAVTHQVPGDLLTAVLGERGRWLAAQQPSWASRLVREDTREPVWDGGDPATRAAFVARLHRDDPAAARELLAAGWSRFTADERAGFTDALAAALGPADEPLLELALTDRRRSTRDAALGLLARLPGSAHAARARVRARSCVHLVPGRPRRLRVTPPAAVDDGMLRDAITAGDPTDHPGAGGIRAHLLHQVVATTPLTHWTDLVGGGPADVLALRVEDDWAPVLRGAWALAALRQREPTWAEAVLPHLAPGPRRAAVLALVPPARRTPLVLPLLRSERRAGQHPHPSVLGECPRPWAPDLAAAALADTLDHRWPASAAWLRRERLDLLARALPPAVPGALREFATRPGLDAAVRDSALRALDVLDVRARLHAELRTTDHEEIQ